MLFELPGKESNVVLASLGCMDDFSKVLNTESAYVVSRGLAAQWILVVRGSVLQLIQRICCVKP